MLDVHLDESGVLQDEYQKSSGNAFGAGGNEDESLKIRFSKSLSHLLGSR